MKNERNYNAAVEALGAALLSKDSEIFGLKIELESVKNALEKAEKALQELQAEKSGALCERGIGAEITE